MKLLEMTLKGFGRLREAHFTFHPEINIIYGPNEAGKSTLQHALIALLYGFYDSSRAQPREQDLHARYRPWDSRPAEARRVEPVFSSGASSAPVMAENDLPRTAHAASMQPTVLHEPKIITAPEHETIDLAPSEAAEKLVETLRPGDNGDGRSQMTESDYSGRLTYSLDSGTTLLLHRDFSRDEVPTQLLDALTGEDWLVKYRRGRHGKADFMEKQIGMSRQVFLATACLQQGALKPLAEREASAVSDAILRLLDAAGADHSAEQAIERLEKKMRELGSDRSQRALLPQARLKLEELRASYALRLATQREAQSDIEKVEFLKIELEELRAQLAALEHKILRAQLAQLEARLARLQDNQRQLEKLTQEIADLLPYKNFSIAQKELFFQLRQDYIHHDRLHAMHQDERAALDIELLALTEKTKNLHVPENIWDQRQLEDFLLLQNRWQATFQEIIDNENARHDVEEALKKAGVNDTERAGFAGLDWRQIEQYKTLEAEVKATEEEVEEARETYDRFQKNRERWQSYATLGAVVLIVSLVIDLVTRLTGSDALGFILPTSLLALLGVFFLYVRWGAQSRELGAKLLEVENRYMEERQQLREVYMRHQITSVSELEEYRLHFEKLSSVVQAEIQLQEKMRKIEQPLMNWMAALGIGHIAPETLQDAEKRLRESHQLWSEKKAAQQRLAQIDEKQAQIEQNLARLAEELQKILRQAGITEPAGENAFQSFLNGCQKREYLEGLQMQLQQAEALHAEILAGEMPEAIAAAMARLREQLRTFEVKAPAATRPERAKPLNEISRVELQRQRETLQQEIHAKEQTLAILQERVAARLQGLPPLAEIEEDIALVEAEVASLENARQALEMARDFMTQAAQRLHRDFAPRLNEFLGRHLGKLTAGRYTSALVDPSDFSVRLQGPSLAAPVELTRLSLGTIEQVYLLLRAAVVEIFAQNGESIPLLLDDPLVHADTRRMKNALAIIDALAASQQIFYFTKDERIFEHFRGKPKQCAIIAL
ncbi:MAG: AAA family ATPase [candidate division KSB1 bacterium]|nr:AAA family ATPase [candidate division KSB1 bacterium]MDZ7369336.1 AAA family ATPase [candidate division KSB1 bacterium]MDZ7407362.1 AAA family ATPase [candidate division KSB1 bacterium]